ncbi:polyprenyl synthetase family protein [Actinomadura harenae]|uniref:Polyprenyl synthetase family protein n=1 Tax=Actinomadura harenae TaxID=2483351 RepID=A0A3M2LU60_9ACTN|nr:polyprenyl synthetase family protein [Actinomadura harenae]RMI40420.1 polyprenyl synthetase family protein [Actinomadura harenae]
MSASVSRPLPHAPSARSLLERSRTLIEPGYRGAVDLLPSPVRRVIGYHAGWWDADGHAADGGGKAIRPALVLAAASTLGTRAPETVVTAAVTAAGVAVEMVHDFSLLHDDVMDRDTTRRHRPAAWTVFGTGQAIVAGDLLLATALGHLPGAASGDVPAPFARDARAVLSDAVVRLCAGQSLDLRFEQRSRVTLDECLKMSDGKTAALLEASCRLGALAGGADPQTAASLAAFGRHLGIAFQLVDDVLGIWGDPAVTGKPAGSDLASRKKSLPVVAALHSKNNAAAELAELFGAPAELSEGELARAAGLVEQAGGRAWAELETRRRLTAAFTALDHAAIPAERQAGLRALASLLATRDR